MAKRKSLTKTTVEAPAKRTVRKLTGATTAKTRNKKFEIVAVHERGETKNGLVLEIVTDGVTTEEGTGKEIPVVYIDTMGESGMRGDAMAFLEENS